MRSRRVLLMLGLLGAAAVFAALALESPVKSLPALATCTPRMTAASCQYSMSQAAIVQAAAQTPLWFYQSYVGLAEGFTMTAVLVFLFPRRWSGRITIPKPIKCLAAANLVFWIAVFISIVMKDWGISIRAYNGLMGTQTMAMLETGLLPPASLSTDVQAIVALGMGVLSATLLKGFRAALLWFAVPMMLLLTAGLLVLAPNSMIDHFAQSVRWYDGLYLVSNWTVLSASLGLLLFGLSNRGQRLA